MNSKRRGSTSQRGETTELSNETQELTLASLAQLRTKGVARPS